jgi:3-dehydroquinate dehydratase II
VNTGIPDRPDASGQRPLLVMLHGANLDLLGERPAQHYGTVTLAELERSVRAEAEVLGWRCECHQTNHEGEFIELVHRYRHSQALLVNPGAWTHYSYAIRDALELVSAPVAEVHLSDVTQREEWRRRSVISDVATVTISGRGPEGYVEAVRVLTRMASDGGPGAEA